MIEKTVTDVVKTTTKLAETGLKKAWSMMDAAIEKQAASEILSSKGLQAIQGHFQGS